MIEQKVPRSVNQLIVIKFLGENVPSTEIHHGLQQQYEAECLSRTRVFEWCKCFREGSERVENEPHDRRLRTSVTEPNTDHTDALIRENRCITINKLEAMLSISVGSVEDIMKYHLHYRKVNARWVPHTLTDVNKMVCMQAASRLLQTFEDKGDAFFLTIRVNRGLPQDLKEECKSLKCGKTTFRRKRDILLQSWRDTRAVNMISTIYNSSMVDVQRRHGQVKKPVCIFKYNMFIKGVDRADQYLAYYSLPQKTVKWTKKVALWLINCAIFNSFLVFKNLNPHSKLKYKAFLLNVAKAWATDQTVVAEPAADTDLV
ncbi:hypothetical protein B7P43_G14505 [Cryptotermes secundus]|uniref:PiggyBac transposable element-derived protein domain-containing protein n=1 Tax=Cryptotermes secundus TaxID=105785 RepID=A0A2J7PMM6_9NEOP|nr:hypothetical protein B7P43_G14505 [Cryptotermes secundus]